MSSVPDSPLIEALPEAERVRLLDRAVARELERGEAFCYAGDLPERVHLIERGVVKLSACDDEGRETVLGLMTPGSWVGDMAVIEDEGQVFDAVAVTHCRVTGVDAALFLDVLEHNAAAALVSARTLAQRIRWMAATAAERTNNDVSGRLAGRLLDLAELTGRMRSGTIELDLPLTQTDVGQLAGVCRESASKTLGRLKRQGVLEHKGRTLRIFRPDVLEKIRCAGRAGEPFRSTDAGARPLPR